MTARSLLSASARRSECYSVIKKTGMGTKSKLWNFASFATSPLFQCSHVKWPKQPIYESKSFKGGSSDDEYVPGQSRGSPVVRTRCRPDIQGRVFDHDVSQSFSLQFSRSLNEKPTDQNGSACESRTRGPVLVWGIMRNKMRLNSTATTPKQSDRYELQA